MACNTHIVYYTLYVLICCYVQLNSQYDYYHPLLFHIVPIPVRFNQTTYYVTEGENSYDLITLEALATPTRSFYVYVTTRDESAVGEHYAVHSLFQYHCT